MYFREVEARNLFLFGLFPFHHFGYCSIDTRFSDPLSLGPQIIPGLLGGGPRCMQIDPQPLAVIIRFAKKRTVTTFAFVMASIVLLLAFLWLWLWLGKWDLSCSHLLAPCDTLSWNRKAKWKSRTKIPSSASSLPPNAGPHDGLLEICRPAAVPCRDRHARQRDRSLPGFCVVR